MSIYGDDIVGRVAKAFDTYSVFQSNGLSNHRPFIYRKDDVKEQITRIKQFDNDVDAMIECQRMNTKAAIREMLTHMNRIMTHASNDPK